MPPTFVFFLAALIYVAVACIVWLTAMILAIPGRTRLFAFKMAAGMAGTFPGIIVSQILFVPPAILAITVLALLSLFLFEENSLPADYLCDSRPRGRSLSVRDILPIAFGSAFSYLPSIHSILETRYRPFSAMLRFPCVNKTCDAYPSVTNAVTFICRMAGPSNEIVQTVSYASRYLH